MNVRHGGYKGLQQSGGEARASQHYSALFYWLEAAWVVQTYRFPTFDEFPNVNVPNRLTLVSIRYSDSSSSVQPYASSGQILPID